MPAKKITDDSLYTIMIDLSYFIFYRYYALMGWWKLAKPDDILGNPIENEEFVEKFKKTFVDKINEIPKKWITYKCNTAIDEAYPNNILDYFPWIEKLAYQPFESP